MVEQRSLVFLNEMRDIEISWDKATDGVMREIIAHKMMTGMKFYVVKPVRFAALRKPLETLADLENIVISDDVQALFNAGSIRLHQSDTFRSVRVERLTTSADEAASTTTVGIKKA